MAEIFKFTSICPWNRLQECWSYICITYFILKFGNNLRDPAINMGFSKNDIVNIGQNWFYVGIFVLQT